MSNIQHQHVNMRVSPKDVRVPSCSSCSVVWVGRCQTYGINTSTCECPLRMYECHHVAAALLYGWVDVKHTASTRQHASVP